MATPINPGDVYKYITVAYKDKEFARNIYPDALAFDGFVKKWFIKPQFKEQEALFKAYNPQYPSAIRVPESHKPFSISRQEVTPLKVKVGPLSTFVLNNLHVKNLRSCAQHQGNVQHRRKAVSIFGSNSGRFAV